MDENRQSKSSIRSLCKSGCGFFGAGQYDGHCSVCFKQTQCKQDSGPTVSSEKHLTSTSTPMTTPVPVRAFHEPSVNILETGSPTVNVAISTGASAPVADDGSAADRCIGASAPVADDSSAASSATEAEQTESPSKNKKRNRCSACKKKVGLTGFECRCGGLYCSVHRYSDKHGCEFDYKEHGADHIRKNNPVVVGQKVQKL